LVGEACPTDVKTGQKDKRQKMNWGKNCEQQKAEGIAFVPVMEHLEERRQEGTSKEEGEKKNKFPKMGKAVTTTGPIGRNLRKGWFSRKKKGKQKLWKEGCL